MDKTLADVLAQARSAYREMLHAEAEMRRLDGYARKTAGMKLDYDKASRVYHENKTIFEQIMRGES